MQLNWPQSSEWRDGGGQMASPPSNEHNDNLKQAARVNTMIKQLRMQHGWSQEQLADFSGLSLRTIQRIESGNKASLESLKSLAAVFEINIEELQKEVVVIDKTSEHWKRNPSMVRAWFLGSNFIKHRRRDLVWMEILAVVLSLGLFVLGFIEQSSWFPLPTHAMSMLCMFCAWGCSRTIRYGDQYSIW